MKDIVQIKDIDLDLAPSKRPKIFEEIRKERGELGLVQVATFGTEGTRSAILTACRGYRSEDFPDGIDVDTAQYLSSLIPAERGFLWELSDVVQGNPEKGRKPIKVFIQEVNKYPGLLEIMQGIENIINKRSSHASGVILFDKEPFEMCSVMRTPSRDLITAYDLHDSEYVGGTKYDFLVTEISDKIICVIELLQRDGLLEKGELREIYNKYLHPSVIDINDTKIWDALGEGSVLDVFQFSTGVGLAAAKKIKPRSVQEMSDANSVMRLMAEKGQEPPLDRYCRLKRDISQWYAEMSRYGLSKEEQKALEPYYLPAYGTPPQQEQLMEILMDPQICGFSLKDANAARKTVAKKKMNEIPALKEHVFSSCKNQNLAQYVWDTGISIQLGYSFSNLHSTAYSWVGIQTLLLATSYNPVYWNTACLIVNSGAGEIGEDDQTDYSKIAKALGDIINKGVKVSLTNINESDFGFKPDVKNNQILFGLKGLLSVGDDLISEIIKNRPYSSMEDFYYKVRPPKQSMISLIKSGAFDQFGNRKKIMVKYLWMTCDKKKCVNLRNFAALIKRELLPEELTFEKRIFEFNRYLKSECKLNPTWFALDERAINFLTELDQLSLIKENNYLEIKAWDKVYKKYMDKAREWMNEHQEEILENLNTSIFMEDWEKYATGSLSKWEMEVMCFYYHEHELAHVNNKKYGLSDFFELPEYPVVEKTFRRGKIDIPIFKLSKICGTCIAKDKIKSTVYLLTTSGVVPVKFRQEHFSLFDKRISEKQEDGTKKVIENSWFNRGNMIMVQGIRREDTFVPKKYASSGGHQLYHIDEILENGDLALRSERKSGYVEED